MRVPAADGYRVWAASYDATPNPLLALEARLLPGILRCVASLCVVDIACGTGRWIARLAESGAHVVGFDLSEPMLAQAARKPAVRGRLALADASSLPVRSETADVALCSFAFGYFPDPERSMLEFARISKRGGRVIVSELNPAAVAAGWKRSFRADGGVCEIEHFGYSTDRIRSAARAAGLALEDDIEARFGQPEEIIFRAAGKTETFGKVA